jgi:hypothetical protein
MFMDEFTAHLNATNLLDAANSPKNSFTPAETAFEAEEKACGCVKLFVCWA